MEIKCTKYNLNAIMFFKYVRFNSHDCRMSKYLYIRYSICMFV